MGEERLSNAIEPAWFGITVGAQPFLVKARTTDEAIEVIADFFATEGATGDGADIVRGFAKSTVHRHPDEFQSGIEERYHDETVVRVKPFTTERW